MIWMLVLAVAFALGLGVGLLIAYWPMANNPPPSHVSRDVEEAFEKAWLECHGRSSNE